MVVLAISGSCGALIERPAARPVNHRFADGPELTLLRRVLVLPFAVDETVIADEPLIRGEFVSELQKLQRFEVVTLPPGSEEDHEITEALLRGMISTTPLVELAKRFHVDGIVTGTILQSRAYRPPVLGLRVQMISVHSGGIAWAADGLYDAGDYATRLDVMHYCATVASPDDSLHGWEMTTLSQRRFARFVAHRLVETWKGEWASGPGG
jgi:hypothetical protein